MEDPLLRELESDLSGPTPARGRWSINDLLSPLLGTSVLLPFAVAFVGVIVSANPVLVPHTPILLSAVILSQALGSLAFSVFSAFVTCTNVDLLSAAFFANLGPLLQQQVAACAPWASTEAEERLCGEEMLVHMLLAQALFTLLVGSALCLVAALDGIWYLRFFPYPVACGFVSGIGLLVLDGGFMLATGQSMRDMAVSWTALDAAVYLNAGVVVLVGLFFLALKRVVHSAMRLPLGLLLVTAGVHAAAHLCGFDTADLRAKGIFLDGLTAEPWTASWATVASRMSAVHLGTFVNGSVVSMTVSYTLLHLLSYPFYAAGMQDLDPVPNKLDLKREIYQLGWTNVALGFLAGVPSCHSYKVCIIMKQHGARSRLWVVLLGLTFLALYFTAGIRPYIEVVPKCAFGGLVFSLGVDFLMGSLVESKQRVAAVEWRAVLVTALLTYGNVLLGIVFGSLLTMGLFIIEYAGITGIVHQATLAEVRSLIKRPREDTRLLQQFGGEVAIFWCSGYIFFGTAANIVEEVEAHLDRNRCTRAVIVDFESVPAVDASGVHALTEFAARGNARSPRVRICFCGLVRRLRLALQNVVASRGIAQGPRLEARRMEQALEWAEDQVLQRTRASSTGAKALSRSSSRIGAQAAVAGDGAGAARRSGSQPGPQQETLTLPLPGLHPKGGRADRPAEVTTQEFLGSLLADIAPGTSATERDEVAAFLAKDSKVRAYEAKGAEAGGAAEEGAIYSEGDPAADLVYIVSGAVSLTRGLEAEPTYTHKLPRHHLNVSKGDRFVFEERSVVRLQVVEQGTVLGAIEFGASHRAETPVRVPKRVTNAIAAPRCQALHVPYQRLHEALSRYPSVGHAAMGWLSKLASAQVLELLKGANMRPYRRASLDEGGFHQAFSFSPKND